MNLEAISRYCYCKRYLKSDYGPYMFTYPKRRFIRKNYYVISSCISLYFAKELLQLFPKGRIELDPIHPENFIEED